MWEKRGHAIYLLPLRYSTCISQLIYKGPEVTGTSKNEMLTNY